MRKNTVFADMRLILAIFITVSLLTMWSASAVPASRVAGNHLFYFIRHLVAAAAGLLFYKVSSMIDMKHLLKMAGLLQVMSILMLILVFIPDLGLTINGARRWIGLGAFRFQPSEWAKLTLILYLTASFHKEGGGVRRPLTGASKTGRAFMVTALTVLLVFLGNDLSTAVLFCSFFIVIYFLSGINHRSALVWASTAVASGGFFILKSGGFRSIRINDWLDYLFKGGAPAYQLKYSIASFRMGGHLGMGYGAGVYKKMLPESHTDFIFSVMGEEMGYLFLLAVISLYIILVLKLFIMAQKAKYDYEKYFLYLTGYLLAAQSIINMGVTVGMFPVTGMTLPLISYGRTSYLTYMILLGLARGLEKNIVRRGT